MTSKTSKQDVNLEPLEVVEHLSTEKPTVDDDMTSTNSNAEKPEVESVEKRPLSTVKGNSDEEATSSSSKEDKVLNSKQAENIASPETEKREQQQQQQQQQQPSSQVPTTSSKFSLVTDYSSSSNDSF